jgi:hypothetical protein
MPWFVCSIEGTGREKKEKRPPTNPYIRFYSQTVFHAQTTTPDKKETKTKTCHTQKFNTDPEGEAWENVHANPKAPGILPATR